jgi:hypothetical protein
MESNSVKRMKQVSRDSSRDCRERRGARRGRLERGPALCKNRLIIGALLGFKFRRSRNEDAHGERSAEYALGTVDGIGIPWMVIPAAKFVVQILDMRLFGGDGD